MRKKTIKLTESDLVKIIHRVIAESTHNEMQEMDDYMDDDYEDDGGYGEMDDELFQELDRKVRQFNRMN